MSHSNGQSTGDKLISKLLNQKRRFEKKCDSKKWAWEEALYEHSALEGIDAKLLASGYYDRAI